MNAIALRGELSSRRLLGVATAVCFALGTAACSPEDAPTPVPTAISTSSPSEVALACDNKEPNPATEIPELQRLIAQYTCVNLIFVDTVGGEPRFDTPPEEYQQQLQTFEELAANSEATSDILRSAFKHATHGRYMPQDVKVQQAPELFQLSGCYNYADQSQNDQLEALTADLEIPGAINYTVLNAENCVNENDRSMGGYTFADGTIVMLQSGHKPRLFVHEAGHFVTLKHAGVGTCKDNLRLVGCTILGVEDTTSVMSYAQNDVGTPASMYGKFTAEEMYKLGLLSPEEVVKGPVNGSFTLRPMATDGGPKLFVGKTDLATDIYISVAEKLSVMCEDLRSIDNANLPRVISDASGEDGTYYGCYTVDSGGDQSVYVSFDSRPGVGDVKDDVVYGANEADVLSLARVDSTNEYELRTGVTLASPWVDGYKVGDAILQTDKHSFSVESLSGESATIAVK